RPWSVGIANHLDLHMDSAMGVGRCLGEGIPHQCPRTYIGRDQLNDLSALRVEGEVCFLGLSDEVVSCTSSAPVIATLHGVVGEDLLSCPAHSWHRAGRGNDRYPWHPQLRHLVP